MSKPTVHVIGAGLAGLSTALNLAVRGVAVRVYEAAGQAGGRCRSYRDARLGRVIDNGNHLVLSGNRSTLAYLARAGARGALAPAEAAAFPFVDLAADRRWTVRLTGGPFPSWIWSEACRVPGTRARDYLAGLHLALAGPDRTVAQAIPHRGLAWRGFWEPLTLAILNERPERGSARLLWRVVRETLARGEAHCRPLLAPEGLSAALVAPAVARLEALSAGVFLNRPLRALEPEDRRIGALIFQGDRVALGPEDRVVLALPPSRLGPLLPGLDLPADDFAILNAHFLVEDGPALHRAPRFTGVLNARAQWAFRRGDVVSVTISAAERPPAEAEARAALLSRLWSEASAALGLKGTRALASRLLVEKRATFDQSPAGVTRRPGPRTRFENLFLAGDVTDTGLPATIEGAIRSGESAAKLAARAGAIRRDGVRR